MDSAEQIRKNRNNMRDKIKMNLEGKKNLFLNKNDVLNVPVFSQVKRPQSETENGYKTRRKTSYDIRQFDYSFDMFECSQIFISTGFQNLFEIIRKIDEGTQSVVKLCQEKQTGKYYAVKFIRTRDLDIQKSLKQQFRILKNLNHQNIVKAYNLFMNQRHGSIHLVTQYCDYQNLRVFINKKVGISQNKIAQIINIVLQALSYLHIKGICHRDIKPENILYDPKSGNLKLIDFQISKSIKYEHQKLEMWTNTGTLHYKAPEMFQGNYSTQIDIWAVGVLTYELLTDHLPFSHIFTNQTIKKILEEEPKYDFPHISQCCISFLKKCLEKDPLKRFDALQALKSPFMLRFSSYSSGSSPKHKRNGSEGIKKAPELCEIEVIKCKNEDSVLTNRQSLNPDGGIRLVVDSFKQPQKLHSPQSSTLKY